MAGEDYRAKPGEQPLAPSPHPSYSRPTMPELVFLRRGEEVLRFGLDRPRTVVGRGDGSDIVIPDAEVSRQHAALLFDGARVTLEDLSGKGTLVAGVPQARAALEDGADIAFGQWRAVYRQSSSADAEAR